MVACWSPAPGSHGQRSQPRTGPQSTSRAVCVGSEHEAGAVSPVTSQVAVCLLGKQIAPAGTKPASVVEVSLAKVPKQPRRCKSYRRGNPGGSVQRSWWHCCLRGSALVPRSVTNGC